MKSKRTHIKGLHILPDGLGPDDFEFESNAELARKVFERHRRDHHKYLNRQWKRVKRIGRIIDQDRRLAAIEEEGQRSREETERYIARLTEAFVKAMAGKTSNTIP